MSGTLPASVGFLPLATPDGMLAVSGTSLSGTLPHELRAPQVQAWNLPSLSGTLPTLSDGTVTLEMYSTRVSGTLPDGFPRNMTVLWLSDTPISGTLPASLPAASPHLTSLKLSGGRLSGSLPSQLASLGSLATLHVYGNRLRGALPALPASLEAGNDCILLAPHAGGSSPTSSPVNRVNRFACPLPTGLPRACAVHCELSPPPSPPPSPPAPMLCLNTCQCCANDGSCGDGGSGSVARMCDYGTDCNDCGPRPFPSPPPSPPALADSCSHSCAMQSCLAFRETLDCGQSRALGCDCSGCCHELTPPALPLRPPAPSIPLSLLVAPPALWFLVALAAATLLGCLACASIGCWRRRRRANEWLATRPKPAPAIRVHHLAGGVELGGLDAEAQPLSPGSQARETAPYLLPTHSSPTSYPLLTLASPSPHPLLDTLARPPQAREDAARTVQRQVWRLPACREREVSRAAETLGRTRETIGNLQALVAGHAARDGGGRFSASTRRLVFGHMADAAKGIEHFMGVTDVHIPRQLLNGVSAIQREFEELVREARRGRADAEAIETAQASLECAKYVLHEEAGSSARLFPNSDHPRDCDARGLLPERRTPSGRGMKLRDFADSAAARQAGLSVMEVAAIRIYSTAAYRSINEPLRDAARRERGVAHPLPLTCFLIDKVPHAPHATRPQTASNRLTRSCPHARSAFPLSGGGQAALGRRVRLAGQRGHRPVAWAEGCRCVGGLPKPRRHRARADVHDDRSDGSHHLRHQGDPVHCAEAAHPLEHGARGRPDLLLGLPG